MHNHEHDYCNGENSKYIAGNATTASRPSLVQEGVHVEMLSGHGDVCKPDVQRKKDDEKEEMDPGQGISAGKDDFEEGKYGIKRVLRDIAVDVEAIDEVVVD